jgi:hypothetical protein
MRRDVTSIFRCHAAAPAAFASQEDTMLGFMRSGGYGMWFLLAMSLVLLYQSGRFAWRATPQRLSIIRALTLAQAFAAITAFVGNVIAVSHFCRANPDECGLSAIVEGLGESIAPLSLGGGLLTLAWILVAIGVGRMPRERD